MTTSGRSLVKKTSPSEREEYHSDADFSSRVDWIVERVGGAGELAKRSGLTRRVIDRYRTEGSEPTRRSLLALAQAAGVEIAWLAAGEGAREKTGRKSPPVFARETPGPGAGYVALPRYDVRAAAGAGEVVQTEEVVDWIHFQQEWLRRTLGVNPQRLVIIEAVGDSMFPTISSGDLLLVDVSEPKLRGEAVYVIADQDALVVKRVIMPGDGSLVLSSDNERYGKMEIERDELERVRIVGRVVWTGGRV